jgi:hypothetical protein
MKKLLSIIILALAIVAVRAQTNDELTLIQSIWGMEKQALVEEFMNLTEEEGAAFWMLYEEYEAARKELGRERVTIINSYVENYTSLTNDKATELMNAAIKNNIAMQKLLQKSFKKMSKSLNPIRAAQFIQLENYLMNMILMRIQNELPFVGELEVNIQ